MGEFTLDASEFISKMRDIESKAVENGNVGLNDAADNLTSTAIDATPIKKGILRGSNSKRTNQTVGGSIEITISFSVTENGFNYALWIHEAVYQLGEISARAGGGTGMSGQYYPVGRKYLERPLLGEKQAYINHISKLIFQGV